MVLINILTGLGMIGHTLSLLALLLLAALAVLVAWVLVLLLLGCGRRPVQVRGGAGYLPGPRRGSYVMPEVALPADWQPPARARGRHAWQTS